MIIKGIFNNKFKNDRCEGCYGIFTRGNCFYFYPFSRQKYCCLTCMLKSGYVEEDKTIENLEIIRKNLAELL